jgi:hypothetical protein
LRSAKRGQRLICGAETQGALCRIRQNGALGFAGRLREAHRLRNAENWQQRSEWRCAAHSDETPAENTAEKQRVMLARNWHDDAISPELGSFCQKSHLIAGLIYLS